MRLLIIEAHLRTGFHAAFDWAVTIDGILAYQHLLNKLGIEKFTLEQQDKTKLTTVDDLPIAKEFFNDDWWYQCSRPFFNVAATHTKHIHRRFNAQEAEQYTQKIGVIQTTKGGYKNARISKTVYLTPKVVWYVNGDADAIRALLKDVTHIGAFRSGGMGAVREWKVLEHDNLDDCRLRRAVPLEFARQNNIQGVQMFWAIRPSSQLLSNKRNCVIPKNAMSSI